MLVKIGPYRSWFGPYQCADLLRFIGVPKDAREWVGDHLPMGPFEWIYSLNKRKVKIKIHPYDTWSMDHTLAMIILPMLKQLKESKHGSPFVDDEDVPEAIKTTNAPPKENDWDTDDFFHQRWEYVLNELVWTFENQIDDDAELEFFKDTPFDTDGYHAHRDRMQNGFRLFGKYYGSLWD